MSKLLSRARVRMTISCLWATSSSSSSSSSSSYSQCQPLSSLSQPEPASEQPEPALSGGGWTDGRTNRISPLFSTGYCPLSKPLPKRILHTYSWTQSTRCFHTHIIHLTIPDWHTTCWAQIWERSFKLMQGCSWRAIPTISEHSELWKWKNLCSNDKIYSFDIYWLVH